MSLRRVSLGYKVRPCPTPTSPPHKKNNNNHKTYQNKSSM